MADKKRKKTKKPRRLRTFFLIVLALLALGIVFLPYLLPTKIIKTGLAELISEALDRRATIDELEFSWAAGIQLTNLNIAQHRDFGPGPLLTIDRVSCPFAPWQLLENRVVIDGLVIDGLDLYALRNSNGQLNFDQLIEQCPDLLGNIKTKDIRLNEITVHMLDKTAESPDVQTININSAHISGDYQDLSRFTFTLPSLRADVIATYQRETKELSIDAVLGIQNNPAIGELRDGSIDEQLLTIRLDRAVIAETRLLIPNLTIRLAENDLTVVADINYRDDLAPTGRIDLLSQQLDLDQVQQFVDALTGALSSSFEYNVPSLNGIENMLPLLQGSDITGKCTFASLQVTDPKTNAHMNLNELASEFHLQEGLFNSELRTSVNGGVVVGNIEVDFNQPDPLIAQRLTTQQLQADESLAPFVESEFPGLEVIGSISEKRDLHTTLSALLQSPDAWLGRGTTVCTEGNLFGPGGPGWMINLFPGLELVEYQWQTMTNQYTMLPDFRKKNTMTFEGKNYDIYIEGTTTAVTDPNTYALAIQALQKDLADSAKQLDLAVEEQSLAPDALKRLTERTMGLRQLLDKHQQAEHLRIYAADYRVGGLLSKKPTIEDLFLPPKKLLRMPFFRSRSYVITRFMVGIQTTNAPLRRARD